MLKKDSYRPIIIFHQESKKVFFTTTRSRTILIRSNAKTTISPIWAIKAASLLLNPDFFSRSRHINSLLSLPMTAWLSTNFLMAAEALAFFSSA